MPGDRTRPRFMSGELLRAEDLTLEQSYQRAGYRLADCSLHTWGIASGLQLARSGQGRVTVGPGFAFDSAGDSIDLEAPVELDLGMSSEAVVWITIRYGEAPSEPAGGALGTFYRRVVVAPVLAVRTANVSQEIDAGMELVLARVELSTYRDVVSIDPSERRGSGVVVGQLTFLNPTSRCAQISAASDPGGLAVHAPQTDIFASVNVEGAVSCWSTSAARGSATAEATLPSAALDIAGAPWVAGHGTLWFEQPGPATDTSFAQGRSYPPDEYLVYGNGTYFSDELSAGDAISAAGATAIIREVLGPRLLRAQLDQSSPPPPARPADFRRRSKWVARLRSGDGQAVLAGPDRHHPRPRGAARAARRFRCRPCRRS